MAPALETTRPARSIDHLAELPDCLAIPSYVQWGWQAHWLAVEDTRTEEGFLLFGREDLEIFHSVAAHGSLDQAVVANTHRRSVFPSAARAEIEAAASDLFRAGLLRPAPGQYRVRPRGPKAAKG